MDDRYQKLVNDLTDALMKEPFPPAKKFFADNLRLKKITDYMPQNPPITEMHLDPMDQSFHVGDIHLLFDRMKLTYTDQRTGVEFTVEFLRDLTRDKTPQAVYGALYDCIEMHVRRDRQYRPGMDDYRRMHDQMFRQEYPGSFNPEANDPKFKFFANETLSKEAFTPEFQVEVVKGLAEIIGVGADPKQSIDDTVATAQTAADFIFSVFEDKLHDVYERGKEEGGRGTRNY